MQSQNEHIDKPGFYSLQTLVIVPAISLAYLGLCHLLIGYKEEQLFLVLLFNACFFASGISRKFILGFSIFIVYWIIFDFMKAFPNYEYSKVNISGLYEAEKRIFGSQLNGVRVSPNELSLFYGNTFLDILSGVFYLCWVPVPLAFAAYLFFKNKHLFIQFSLTFLFVNLIGFVIYYTYPAAPPWYIQVYGTSFIPGTPGYAAGLLKFDEYFNSPVFQGIYSKSSNVFAAMPSLHASYPVIVLYYGIKQKLRWANVFFGVVMLGIWFAAVYTSHHYWLDVLAGVLCAMTGILIYTRVLVKTRWYNKFHAYYVSKI